MAAETAKTVATLVRALAETATRRLARGPKRAGWDFQMELAGTFLQRQMSRVAALDSGPAQRAVVDAISYPSPAVKRVRIEPWNGSGLTGRWFTPRQNATPGAALLYFHGGGYVVHAKGHSNLEALMALATKLPTLVPEYRMAPEHPYPAALDDALASYRWLLSNGLRPERLVVAGDSAGGGLTAALLLRLRDLGEPLPTLGILLSPWVDLGCGGASFTDNAPFDWITPPLIRKWAGYYLNGRAPNDPFISPVHGEFRGLPPLYVQAGEVEILYDQIAAFVAEARAQGADVAFDHWADMNHEFQAFSPRVREAREALEKVGKKTSEALASITKKADAVLG